MIDILRPAIGLSVLLMAGCASMQVDRDLKHAELSQQYRTAVAQTSSADPGASCITPNGGTAWTHIEFNPTTPIAKLPTGTNAAAFCVRIPDGARAMEMHADAKGGMTYFELIVLHPSQQFLDGDKQLIKDLPEPKLSPQDTLNGFGLYGVTVLTTELSTARYVLVYVHPASLDGAVDVYTGYHTIPVPYGPYGQVKVRFK
ncbi:hypothetical protein [Pseudoxanthomonas sp. Root630]|uniref:hypothetical protein n=1 Tax=Pseudoxanthomonas sp. Root630 TaxID=1736574 RepID=UPI0007035DEC|nr:hypothetical protein [Pseudoxanthomonas sp. Root630]KRA46596.1 hypothetical protein ASD72_05210 [Pseudoxanthomonas sp. Root630]